jgi:hypothetical protein
MNPAHPVPIVSESSDGTPGTANESQVSILEQINPGRDTSLGPFLLNQKQAAALLGISPRTLARRSTDGTIPSFLIGRRRVYSRFRLAQWVAERAA